MGIIEALDNTSSEAAEKGQAYVKTTKKYYELKVFQQLAIFSSSASKWAIYGGLCTLGLIFLAVAAALALSQYFNNAALGFLSIGLLFFLILGIALVYRKKIEQKVIQKLSENFFDQ
ncbi:Hypothetical protein I595_1786 [Croceitalea dokdonensis DOKDO 023]|uniref:Competence protein n=1 Tax=Croceitalea dokdonensis DOKDO 023 TaxID=1300341 RepID=A0A0P7A628_9FLAO|nr:hypothetical protein [Croceitalea dokdonensis]KPM32137.1 Hypothetical protein I595_1786 [Croceitalea dokdonensis DOKDO 023]